MFRKSIPGLKSKSSFDRKSPKYDNDALMTTDQKSSNKTKSGQHDDNSTRTTKRKSTDKKDKTTQKSKKPSTSTVAELSANTTLRTSDPVTAELDFKSVTSEGRVRVNLSTGSESIITSSWTRGHGQKQKVDHQYESVSADTQTSEKTVFDKTSVNNASPNDRNVYNGTTETTRGQTMPGDQPGRSVLWWLAVVGSAGAGLVIIMSALTVLFYRPWRRRNRPVQLRKQPKRAIENVYGDHTDSVFVKDLGGHYKSRYSKMANKDEDRFQSVFSWATEFEACEPVIGEGRSSIRGEYANTTLLLTQSNLNDFNKDVTLETDIDASSTLTGSTEPLRK
ncbi:hypothetical protein Btru_039949 [Bulinus truncatus]|nr:hypothetical protein Btru_039949 [Bulinus truncatus]